MNIKLSIITPYYNTLKYIKELNRVLSNQLRDDVEWIIVDDGCLEKELDTFPATVIHLLENSGNASKPRNIGLDTARGEYIAFIDSDDLVSLNYVDKILDEINSHEFDYCYISWKMNDIDVIIENEAEEWNRCVWNCIYRRDLIGKNRFREELNINEDGDFNDRVRKGRRSNIKDVLYIYQVGIRDDSLTTLYSNGKIGDRKDE